MESVSRGQYRECSSAALSFDSLCIQKEIKVYYARIEIYYAHIDLLYTTC